MLSYDYNHTGWKRKLLFLAPNKSMGSSLRRWLHISFLNLLIVAFLGVILRYKIAFSLPFIDQRNLHHGHSHFAFFGWITQVLMVLMVHYLQCEQVESAFKKYRWWLYLNLLSAYGMLISFSLQGYGIWSIGFHNIIYCWFLYFCLLVLARSECFKE